jgi:trehalose-phosphatase
MIKNLLNSNYKLSPVVKKTIQQADIIILFLDYDGTLAPIKKTPAQALPSAKLILLLNKLKSIEDINLFIVTGRSYKDILNLIGIPGINIISDHGLEFNYDNKKWVHNKIHLYSDALFAIKSKLKKSILLFKGAVIEEKKYSIALHYRNMISGNVSELKKIVENIIQPFSNKVKLTYGKKVIEIRPVIKWNKGLAVLKMLRILKLREGYYPCIYIGDDKTDEDAFKVLNNNQITIHVGKGKHSLAKFSLRNTKEVLFFLGIVYLIHSKRRQE